MTINLIETIQKNLQLPALHKVDPNTQDVKLPEESTVIEKLAQASIPAVLTAFYKLSRTVEGSEIIQRGNFSTSWINTLFGEDAPRAVGAIDDYAHSSYDTARDQVEAVAVEAARVITENGKDADGIKRLLTDERTNTLTYLPAALQIGDLLNDSTLDDRTNKMKGPISSMMHSIEEKFSEGDETQTPK